MGSCEPVLFLVFNRPDVTAQVFEAIRHARPARLYVAADGPRASHPEDAARCHQVRQIVSAVDWPCELRTLFRAENLGCRLGPSQAVSWFFEHEEQGIILEDDCLPSSEFFEFASSLLRRYKDDGRVMKINGFNPLGSWSCADSYFYSYFGYAWGWASWRRAWEFFSEDISQLADELGKRPSLSYPFFRDRLDVIDQLLQGLDAWDFQWEFAISAQHGLQLIPRTSLIRNIGFGADATHTLVAPKGVCNLQSFQSCMPMKHPLWMLVQTDYEQALLKTSRLSVRQKIKRWLKRGLRVSMGKQKR